MIRILTVIFIFLFLGCENWPSITKGTDAVSSVLIGTNLRNQPTNSNSPYNEGSQPSRGDFKEKSSCSNPQNSDLELYDLDYIDASNIGKYVVEGRCRGHNKISIEVNGYPISESPYCDSYRWKVVVDLTPVASEETSVSFRISSGRDTLCQDVKVAFVGPKNYLAISPLDNQYETGFFVMKYEAKEEEAGVNSRAISVPENRPISRVSYADAVRFCRNNGTRYDLISNEQWQNIAQAIESVDENWSLNQARVIDGNTLNCGVNIGTIKAASSSDDEDCATSACDRGWDYRRRTHLLPSGHRIWDMCGNVGEMMKTKNTRNSSFSDFVYKMINPEKAEYGPDKNYHDTLFRFYSKNQQWGLGFAELDEGGSLIVRGGQHRNAGIFSVHTNYDYDNRTAIKSNIGFRCVYLP